MEANESWGKAQFHETESYNLIRKSKVKVEIKLITPSNTAHLWVVYHSENLKKYKFFHKYIWTAYKLLLYGKRNFTTYFFMKCGNSHLDLPRHSSFRLAKKVMWFRWYSADRIMKLVEIKTNRCLFIDTNKL